VSGRVRDLLARRALHLTRELGQNFITDEGLAARLAEKAGVGPEGTVIEVGTGLGVLTRALAARGARVISFEIDSGLVAALRDEALLPGAVELVHADALKIDWDQLLEGLPGPVRVVANLPYSAATPLLRRMLDLRDRLSDWSVMVQRELAARILARRGQPDYGSFAVLHHLTVDVAEQMTLPPGAFFPRPRVQSSFVRIWPRKTALLRAGELAGVERVVRAAFAQRRKTILNSLRGGGLGGSHDREALLRALETSGIDPVARAESVEPERLLALARALG
jgi:16S rRNA (adenine1518-N6/adenine1519-N6)-dimethyltransferase